MKAVLFKSDERFYAFEKELKRRNIDVIELDFTDPSWIDFDYSDIDFVIYYPSFDFNSTNPLALHSVKDNLLFIYRQNPEIKFYPDPRLIFYYNDKYRQFLFLRRNKFPVPETIPLYTYKDVDNAAKRLGFPCVVKNRFGAGGDAVFKVNSRKELKNYFEYSRMNMVNLFSLKQFLKIFTNRLSLYFLFKEKKMKYPFFSYPLLAQKFVHHEKDIKVVLYKSKVIESHWRGKANKDMWKVNIDAGGVGVWGKIPQEVLDLSSEFAKTIQSLWINLDLLISDNKIYISEFSPVWHHYRFKEKESFVYKDDYNLDIPLETSLNLEKIIVDSLVYGEVRK